MNAAAAKGLGKGLSALMGEEYSQSMTTAEQGAMASDMAPALLPLHKIEPGIFQPRHHFDEEYINELADSIEKNGVMQPIIVRPKAGKSGHYEIVAGERRWRASKLAKLERIPVIVRDIDDRLALELALVENIQRQDLNPLEEAAGYQRLIDEFSYTQESIARTVGKSRSHIANLLRMLALPKEVQSWLRDGTLTMGHAKAIAGSGDIAALARQIVKENLNVRQTELLARGEWPPAAGEKNTTKEEGKTKAYSSARTQNGRKEKDQDIIALEETLSQNLGLNVSIHDLGNHAGEVVIRYQSLTQLDDVLRRLSESI